MSDTYPDEYRDGEVEFFYQKFVVNHHVLIPRYETEMLVRKGIEICKEYDIDTIVDIGTGSGIIPISIASNVELRKVIAIDISLDALIVAQENADRHIGSKLQTYHGDLLEPILSDPSIIQSDQPVLFTANLPYVGTWEKDMMSEDTIHEPDIALFGDSPDGFDIYRRFFPMLAELKSGLLGHQQTGQSPDLQIICLIEFGMWQRDLAEEELGKYPWKYSFFEDERGIERFACIELAL